jgi:hypothetical protein
LTGFFAFGGAMVTNWSQTIFDRCLTVFVRESTGERSARADGTGLLAARRGRDDLDVNFRAGPAFLSCHGSRDQVLDLADIEWFGQEGEGAEHPRFGRSNQENDFNFYAKRLFVPGSEIFALAERFPRIAPRRPAADAAKRCVRLEVCAYRESFGSQTDSMSW